MKGLDGLGGSSQGKEVVFGKTSARAATAEDMKKFGLNSVWESDKKLKQVKLDLPTGQPVKLAKGAKANDVAMALATNTSLVSPFPKPKTFKDGTEGTVMEYYDGGKLSKKGDSVEGGRLVAIVENKGQEITSITDGSKHKFKVEDGTLQ